MVIVIVFKLYYNASGDIRMEWIIDTCNSVLEEGKVPEDHYWRPFGEWLIGFCCVFALLEQYMKVLERIMARKVME